MLRTFLASFLVLLPVSALAEDVVADSHISAVTVYSDRASVTRTATIDLPAGASTIVLNGLPETLFADSLRAEGEAEADVVLGAIESKIVSSSELAAPRERELNTKLLELNDQRALVAADQQALQQKQQFLATLGQQASLRTRENIAEIDLKPDQWKGAAEALSVGMSETLRAVAGKSVEIRQLDELIAAVQTELNQIQTGGRNTLQVKVPLETRMATRLALRVTYQIPNAGWAPNYDARLETESGKVALTQFGEVRQQTGEDWSDVKLVLSTAQPARNAALPQLDPMWVNLYDPRVVERRTRAMSMEDSVSNVAQMAGTAPMSEMAMEMAVPASAPVMKAAAFQAATLNAGGYVSEYAIPGTVSILADGTAKKVMIGNLEVTSQLLAKIKPQLDSQAYLVARTKLGGEVPLLPGQANLFRDGAFIGTTQLAMLRPGEETDLGFGIDDQIVVKHRVMEDEAGESGVISRDNTRRRVTITEVQNLHRTPVSAILLQTIPASQNENIKLEMLQDKTTHGYAENVDNVKGLLRWSFRLEPQQKQELGLGWVLSWPKNSQIAGLPF